MARRTAFHGQVPRIEILDESGNADPTLVPGVPPATIVAMYEAMVLTRSFDNQAFLLQREGRIGTYAQSLGQEAAQVGSAFALEPGDWVVPSYRENGVLLCRGIPLENILVYWGGDERGMLGFRERRCLPFAIPVGTQTPHAVGMAMAARLRGEPTVVACYMGDGATSTGDFHEGMTMAGVFAAPVVFVCQNNHYAISVPRSRQCAAATLAQKALGYGVAGVQVDGNDVLACYVATREAVERARRGEGATFVEAVTYRLADHTTADDSSRYRDTDEVQTWRRRDPVLRLRLYLDRVGLWDDGREADLAARCRERVDAAVRAAEAMPPPDPADIERFTFANPIRRAPSQAAAVGGDGGARPRGGRVAASEADEGPALRDGAPASGREGS